MNRFLFDVLENLGSSSPVVAVRMVPTDFSLEHPMKSWLLPRQVSDITTAIHLRRSKATSFRSQAIGSPVCGSL